jgi:threonine synthase
VALSAARAFGYTTVSCASTGNLANSVAAHATQAGLRAVVFIPDDLEQGKVVQTAVYGQTLVAVQGTYDDVNRLCSEIAENEDWAFVNVNVRPYYAEGSKTLGTRSPSSSAGASRRRSSCRWRPARCSPRSTRPSAS